MPGLYYAAVEGDPLTSGEGSRVYGTQKTIGTIEDENGQPRNMVFIGDEGYCAKCDSTGSITYGAGVSERKRMVDLVNGGRLQAVGGDIVLCQCANPPRIIAMHGRRWMIHDQGEATRRTAPGAPAQSLVYDEQFTLIDGNGRPMPGTYYTLRVDCGSRVHGTTDSAGRTARHRTNGARSVAIYLGHRKE